MTTDHFSSAGETAFAIRSRRLSSMDALEAVLERIGRHNPALNAICTLDEAGARKRAAEADAALARGELWGPLHGVPITLKDAIETAGLRTTGGFPPLADHVPARDAPVAARMRAAGGVLVGKTNVPPLSADYRADNPIFGRTNNPWNLGCSPGGSTGGGGAAIAAGLSYLEIGSDIAGSIRIPAHFCGVFGLKPTEHRVPGTGHIPEPPGMPRGVRHMNCLGPLARSVQDLELALRLIAGPDGIEIDIPPVPLEPAAPRPLRGARIAWMEDFAGLPLTRETRASLRKLAADLQGAGCIVEQRSPPDFDLEEVWETWGEILLAERASTAPERAAQRVADLNASEQSPEAIFRGFARGAHASIVDYARSLSRRDALIAAFERFIGGWDALLCPVSLGPAVAHIPFGTPIAIDGRDVPYFIAGTGLTSPFNLTGSPVVVLPLARSDDGLPIGVQLVGRRWGEIPLLALAESVAQLIGPYVPPPAFAD
ncbi:MAG: amidase [Betaproteobacteria bacterium]|nr:amidase [Betaproteobacteria bacterium]